MFLLSRRGTLEYLYEEVTNGKKNRAPVTENNTTSSYKSLI